MSSYEPILGPHPIHLDDDDDEGNAPMVKAPVVDSAKDRLNPEVEYEVLDLAGEKPEALKNKLNELGKDGWQLLATTPSFIFRRMKKAEEEKKRGRVGFSV